MKYKKYLRIDIIYSNDYDKIFVGATKDEKSYYSSSVFNMNEIDKFILQKNSLKEKGFHLISFLKGNNLKREICYIEDSKEEIEGLIYILNERINKVNNNP